MKLNYFEIGDKNSGYLSTYQVFSSYAEALQHLQDLFGPHYDRLKGCYIIREWGQLERG